MPYGVVEVIAVYLVLGDDGARIAFPSLCEEVMMLCNDMHYDDESVDVCVFVCVEPFLRKVLVL